jgi:hypothetical protein
MADASPLASWEPKAAASLEYSRQVWESRVSPCGAVLAAAGYDGLVPRWDLRGEAPKAMASLSGHSGWVQAIAFAPVGERLVTSDSWGRLACWKSLEEAPAPVWNHAAAHEGWIRAVAISPDGKLVASAGNDRVIRIRSVETGETLHTWDGHAMAVFSLAFHPSGKSLVSGDWQGIVKEWDLASGKVVRELKPALAQLSKMQDCGGVRRLAFNPDGSVLACGGQKEPQGGFATGIPSVVAFEWATGKELPPMNVGTVNDGFVYDLQFLPSGILMGTSGAFPGTGHLWFWRPGEEKEILISKAIPNGRSLSLFPDGKRMAMTVCLSANANGKQLKDGKYDGGSAKIHFLDLPAG